MTDTEIIKALECCGEHKRFCDGCTYNNKTVDYCDSDLCKDAVALIKRQKAEVDILIRKKDALRDEIAEQKAEIEKLKAEAQMAGGYAEQTTFEKVEHNSLCETETYKVGE